MFRLSLGNTSIEISFLVFFQANKQILTSTNQAEQKHPSHNTISGLVFQKAQKLLLYIYLSVTFFNLTRKLRNPHRNQIQSSWIYQLWPKKWCLTNLISAHPGEMKLETANVYFSMLTMATDIIAYWGIQDFIFFPSLDLFSCEQQLKKPTMWTHHKLKE